jgi:polyvinyl alcohol dehydrogenase (cytochrome)
VHGNTVYVGVASLEELVAADPSYLCCTFRGSVVALDATTGAIKWKAHTTPDNGGAAGGYAGAGVWGSTPVVDTQRGLVYVTSGNNYAVPATVATCVAGGGGLSCNDPANRFDSIIALDLNTGAIRWSTFAEAYDAWNLACIGLFGPPDNCPTPAGPDYDFGSGPNLFTLRGGSPDRDIVGAGQKSGIYWALNPDNGQVLWSTQVGPGGETGGIQWGSAVDGTRVYVAIANSRFQEHLPGLPGHFGGSFGALDAATGQILWQTPEAIGAPLCPACPPLSGPIAPLTVANDVVYGGTLTGFFRALDAATGAVLWSYPAGGSVGGGAAVARGMVYWGSGFGHFGPLLGSSNNELYAFSLD